MDGITASRHIIKYCDDNSIKKPIICVLTAYDNADNYNECIQVGIHKVMIKPFQLA